MSRHMYCPFTGNTLNGESVRPCSRKIGPSRNARQEIDTPRLAASASMRIAAG
jgi:hypothetical protein